MSTPFGNQPPRYTMSAESTSAVPALTPIAPAIPDYSNAFIALVDSIDRLNNKVEQIRAKQLNAPETKQEIVSIGPMGYTYDGKGYKYFGLFAPTSIILNVTYMGVNYAISLNAGFNDLVLVDGAALSTSAQTSLIAIWSDHLEVVDKSNVESARRSVAITPSDSISFEGTRGIYVGSSGDVRMTMTDGTIVTRKNLTGGMTHPLGVTRIWATGTTATDILGDY